MALVELSFADHSELIKQGRSFTCSKCDDKIKALRRCKEDREDFTAKDASFWPIYISPGGEPFSFCPGKATWDNEAMAIFKILTIAAESGNIELCAGGIYDQPDWWIEYLSWFLPRYSHHQFTSRAKMILGDGKKSATSSQGK